MQRRDFLLAGAVLSGGAIRTPATIYAQAVPPSHDVTLPLVKGGVYQAGSKTQLFVDQMLVQSMDKVTFTLHPARKHRANPLVMADQPWEGWAVEILGSVIFDEQEKLFKMWYLCESPEYFPRFAALYATSKDGIHWKKPLVGTIESAIPCQHNAVTEGCQLANVYKDNQDPDPARRYKMISMLLGKGYQGYYTFVSNDGLHWTQFSEKPICPWMDVINSCYDRERKLWVALAKNHTGIAPGLPHARRVFSLTTSVDFKNWSEPQLVLYPDLRDDAGSMARIEAVRPKLDVPDDPSLVRTEFYGVGFYQAESCVLGFPWVFTINNNARFGNHEGPCEIQLAVTRDFKNWERPFRVPCVPRGAMDDWDSGFFTTASEALRVKDEIWLYYSAFNSTHGNPCNFRADGTGRKTTYTSSIGLAIWPLDRFVSVDGPAHGGTLTTVPLAFTGNRLELNVNAAAGAVRVELLNAAGAPLKEFGPSDVIKTDSLRQTVTWNGNGDLTALRANPVSLRFHLQTAELYSFAFRD